MNKGILDTERVKFKWEDKKLKIFDSDEHYFDYICERESFCEDTSKKLREIKYICHLQSDYELAMYIVRNFCSTGLVKSVVPDADFSTLRNLYGTEYVNRIGSVAIIVNESSL